MSSAPAIPVRRINTQNRIDDQFPIALCAFAPREKAQIVTFQKSDPSVKLSKPGNASFEESDFLNRRLSLFLGSLFRGHLKQTLLL